MSECEHCGDAGEGTMLVDVPADRVCRDVPDATLCERCHEMWIHTPKSVEGSDDPTLHQWTTVDAAVKGRGSMSTYAVERCVVCGDLRVDDDVEVVAEVPADA